MQWLVFHKLLIECSHLASLKLTHSYLLQRLDLIKTHVVTFQLWEDLNVDRLNNKNINGKLWFFIHLFIGQRETERGEKEEGKERKREEVHHNAHMSYHDHCVMVRPCFFPFDVIKVIQERTQRNFEERIVGGNGQYHTLPLFARKIMDTYNLATMNAWNASFEWITCIWINHNPKRCELSVEGMHFTYQVGSM